MARDPRTFLLLHGAFHGAWCWARVADRLRAAGHRVFVPTQTGLGARRHLLSAAITLDTFVQDVTLVLESEELTDVVLVGHSFGGIAISGAADRMPERIRRMVYLDSRILEDGESAADADLARTAERRRLADEFGAGIGVPPPPPAAFGVPDGPDADWVRRRLTPHPIGTMESPLRLRNPVGNGLPCTYIACTAPYYDPLEPCRRWARGRPGWQWAEMATGHDAMVTDPEALTRMLEEIAG